MRVGRDMQHRLSPRRVPSAVVANRNYLIHQYDEVNRELTWLTLARDLPEWKQSLATLRTRRSAKSPTGPEQAWVVPIAEVDRPPSNPPETAGSDRSPSATVGTVSEDSPHQHGVSGGIPQRSVAVGRRRSKPEVAGSNPAPATNGDVSGHRHSPDPRFVGSG